MVDHHACRIAQIGNALGHARRVRILKLLIKNPKAGRSYGTLQSIIGIPDASLRHHLHVLEMAALILRTREGAVSGIRLKPGSAQQEMMALLSLLSNPSQPQIQRSNIPGYSPRQDRKPVNYAAQHLPTGKPVTNTSFIPQSSAHPP